MVPLGPVSPGRRRSAGRDLQSRDRQAPNRDRPTVGETTTDLGSLGSLGGLQRAVGNRATGALFRRVDPMGGKTGVLTVQRKSQAKELAANDGEALTKALVAMSDADLIDTVFDPSFAKRHPSAGLMPGLRALGPAGAKGVAAVRGAAGPYDEDFYYSLGLIEPHFRTQLWDRLAKDKPKIANPSARTGTIASAFMGLCRSNAYADAMGLVAKYNLDDIIDVLLIAHAGGLLRELEAHWADAKGIDTSRLRAAVSAVRLQGVLTAIGAVNVPVGDVMAKATNGKLDDYEKDLDKLISDKTVNDVYKEKCRNTKAILGLARASVTQLGLDAGSLSKEDLASLNRFLGGGAATEFSRVINSPEAHTAGQFVLSSAVSTEVNKVINEQLRRLGTLDADLQKRITAANDALAAAITAANPGDARSSYVRVDQATGKLRTELAAAAKAKGKTITVDTRDTLKVALPLPPVKSSYADVLGVVWMPLWKKWLDTKKFPDLSEARNVYKLAYLRMADQWACQPMAMKLVELYDARATGGEVRTKDPKFAFGPVALYRNTKLIKDKGSGLVSETVLYRSDLAQRVEQMRQALDHGWFVHVRVMSGVKMDYTTSRAAAEHSLMVVGHRGNAFMCADTDPGGEGAVHNMTGYAGLFYDSAANTLGSGVGAGLEVDDAGMQPNHRHRYQAWTIATR